MLGAANATAQTLAKAAVGRLVYPVEANELFLKVTAGEAAQLRAQGFDFYDWGLGEIRLVTSWDQEREGGRATGRGYRRTVSSGPASTFRTVTLPFIVFTMIWGSTWIVIRGQLGTVPPQWSVAYRFTIAAAAMALISAAKGDNLRLGRGGLAAAAFLGFTQFCVNFNAVYLAERHITSGVVATVFALLLIPSSLMGWAFLGQRPTQRFAWSSLVAVAGIALLFVHELRAHAASTGQIVTGIGVTLIGMVGASIANVVQARPEIRRFALVRACSPGRWPPGRRSMRRSPSRWRGPPIFDPRPAYWAGLLYLALAGLGADLQPLLSGRAPDRPSQSCLFERARADHRDGLFDVARGLSVDFANRRRRPARARRDGRRVESQPLLGRGSRRWLMRLGGYAVDGHPPLRLRPFHR